MALSFQTALAQIEDIMFKKPEATMAEVIAIHDAKSEEHSALQKRADELYVGCGN
jgi:hypothetical protein